MSKVYQAQKIFPIKDDFVNQVKEDMEDIGLDLEENTIKNMKKAKFKSLVKGKIREASHSYLVQKQEGCSKLMNLPLSYNIKEYLTTNRLSTSEKQLLFKLRTHMIQVKGNYSSMFKDDMSCRLCDTNSEESQEYILSCPSLATSFNINNVKYMDIYDQNLDIQITAVKHWNTLLKNRTIKMNELKLLFGEAKRT